MDSQLLMGSYKRYKEDTTTFLSWLLKEATACGYSKAEKQTSKLPPNDAGATPSVTPSLGERLREKAAKKTLKREEQHANLSRKSKAHPASLQESTTKELLLQAQLVAANPKADVPQAMIQLIERAVDARKQCAKWFQTVQFEKEQSNRSHQYFIGVLEQIVAILLPKCRKETPKGSMPNVDASPIAKVENSMHSLAVDDAENSLEDSADASAPRKTSGPDFLDFTLLPEAKWKTQPVNQEELDEMRFASFCFFQDMHRIQDFVNETWQMYKRRELDLVTASFVTNAAINIVKQAEVEVTEMLFPDMQLSYASLADLITSPGFPADGIHPPTMDERLQATQFTMQDRKVTSIDALIYHRTARTLGRIMTAANIEINQGLWSVLTFYHTYADRPELHEDKNVMDSHLFLTQMVSETLFETHLDHGIGCLPKKWVKRSFKYGTPAQIKGFPSLSPALIPEGLSKGIRELRGGNHLTTSLVFAAQILSDIRFTLGDQVSEAAEELKVALAAALENAKVKLEQESVSMAALPRYTHHGEAFPKRGIMEAFLDTHTRATGRRWELYKESWLKLVQKKQLELEKLCEAKNQEAIRDGIEEEPIPFSFLSSLPIPKAVEWATQQSTANAVSPDLAFYTKHNPSNCGIRMLEMIMQTEKVGITITNYHKSIWLVAHLYNAARQTRVLKGSWLAMDGLIDLHLTKIFHGKLPQSSYQMCTWLSMGYGVLPSHHLAHSRLGNSRAFIPLQSRATIEEFTNLPCSKVSDILRMLGDHPNPVTMEHCLYQISNLIQGSLAGNAKGKSKKRENTKLTSIQLLERLRTWFPKAVKDMQVDYIGINQDCTNLLQRIRLTILVELGLDHKLKHPPRCKFAEAGYHFMVSRILSELRNPLFNPQSFKQSSDDKVISTPQMMVVGKVFQKFVDDLEVKDVGSKE